MKGFLLPAGCARLPALLASLLAAACSSEGGVSLGSQHWGDLDVTVETRPAPARAGSNEAVVILSGPHRRPVYDAVVCVQGGPQQPSTGTARVQSDAGPVSGDCAQAIQDGHVGVYRRAVRFPPGAAASLEVTVQRGGQQANFVFPLALSN
jgi:hypothetical protein